MGRTQPLKLDTFCGVGFIRFSWLRPNETSLLKNVSCNFIIDHRDFLFFCEDGNTVVFSVDPLGCTNQNGNVCFISEAFESISEAKFDQKSPIQPIYNGLTWEW